MTKEDKLEVLDLLSDLFEQVESLVKNGETFRVERILDALEELKNETKKVRGYFNSFDWDGMIIRLTVGWREIVGWEFDSPIIVLGDVQDPFLSRLLEYPN